jgi:hypothetical protein
MPTETKKPPIKGLFAARNFPAYSGFNCRVAFIICHDLREEKWLLFDRGIQEAI